jgi:transposase InsO family protein
MDVRLLVQFQKPEPIKPTALPTGPWQDLSIDILGPLTSGQHAFVVEDYFSGYYEIEITKDITSEKLIDVLEGMFCRNGLPVTITSDNGPQFKSETFASYMYMAENGIKHRRVTPLHPAANGEVERQNRSLMKRIRIVQAESKYWRKEIRKYLFAYRTTPHSTTGVSPAE